MVWLTNLVLWPYRKIKEELAYRKRLKELKESDPFVYEEK